MPDNEVQGIDENALFGEEVVSEEKTQESVTAKFLGKQEPTGSDATNQNANPNPDSFEDYVETTVKAVNPDYKLPEMIRTGKKADGTALTAKERHDLLTAEIINNTDFEVDDDEFVKQYKVAKASGIDTNSFISQFNSRVNMLNMPSAEFIRNAYQSITDAKGERKYSDADIDKLIEGKSQIELDQYAGSMKQQFAKAQYQKLSQDTASAIDAENKKYQPIVDSYVQKLKSEQSVYGFELSTEEKETLGNEVSKMFVRNPKNGSNEFERMMSDDQFVLTVAPLLLMVKNGKFNTAMTAMREKIKAKALEKLDQVPPNGQGGAGIILKVDEAKLYND